MLMKMYIVHWPDNMASMLNDKDDQLQQYREQMKDQDKITVLKTL